MSYIEAISYATPSQLAARKAHIERRRRIFDRRVIEKEPEASPVAVIIPEPKPPVKPCPRTFESIIADIGGHFQEQPFGHQMSQDAIAPRKSISMRQIQVMVARACDVPLEEMLSQRRTQQVVRPRQLAMMLCKMLTLNSLPAIGRAFEGRDHTTILHATRKYEPVEAALKPFVDSGASIPEVIARGVELMDQLIPRMTMRKRAD